MLGRESLCCASTDILLSSLIIAKREHYEHNNTVVNQCTDISICADTLAVKYLYTFTTSLLIQNRYSEIITKCDRT